MTRPSRYPKELRERAVRIVLEHRGEHPSEWAAISSIAAKLGVHRETVRLWVRREQIDAGDRAGLTTEERERLRQLERENRELRRANDILTSASEWLSEHFSPGRRAGVYREIIRRAELLGGMGESVVMDATWSSADPRALAGAAARTARCALVALRCDVPAHVAEHRVAHRIAAGTDISMATVAVARQIAARFEPWPDAVVIGTGQPLADALSSAVTAIDTARLQARFEIREADQAHHGGDSEPPAREA
jgi:predicted kinase